MKTVTYDLICKLISETTKSPRNRANHNLHTNDSETSRFINVGNKKTYWVPHYHSDKWEDVVILNGTLGILKFDDLGNVIEKIKLDGMRTFCVEIEPREWHTFVALRPPVAVFESKKGPYDAKTDKVFAPWAPAEDSEEGKAYLEKLRSYFNGH